MGNAKKTNIFYIFLVITVFISCSNKVELDGYWQGQKVIFGSNYPSLLKFEKNILTDYSSINDTLAYIQTKHNLVLIDKFGERQTVNYELKNSILYFYNAKTDSLISKYRRPKSKNLIDDILLNKSYKVQLPNGNGISKRIDTDFDFEEPLFIFYESGKLNIDFRGQKRIVDDNLYKFIEKNRIYSFKEKEYISISLIADKSIYLTEIELIKQQLSIAGFKNVKLLLSSNKYDFANSFGLKLEPLLKIDSIKYNIKLDKYDIPVTLPKFEKNNSIVINIKGSSLSIGSQQLSKEDLRNFIKEKYIKNGRLNIFYSYDSKTNYQNYISVLDIAYNSILEIRNNYLKEKYKIDYYSKKNEHREIINESKKVYPFIFANSKIFE